MSTNQKHVTTAITVMKVQILKQKSEIAKAKLYLKTTDTPTAGLDIATLERTAKRMEDTLETVRRAAMELRILEDLKRQEKWDEERHAQWDAVANTLAEESGVAVALAWID